jgi:hypothetical protein
MPIEQLLSWIAGPTAGVWIPPGACATTLLTGVQMRYPVPEIDYTCNQHCWGIIGMRDSTLNPMIPPGSLVQINPQNKSACDFTEWSTELHRPVYCLVTRSGYLFGWCDVERECNWLTLIPHPLSVAPVRRWQYRTEIEVIGRVVAVGISLTI